MHTVRLTLPRPVNDLGGEVMRVSKHHFDFGKSPNRRLCGSRDRDKIEAPFVRLRERGAKSFAS